MTMNCFEGLQEQSDENFDRNIGLPLNNSSGEPNRLVPISRNNNNQLISIERIEIRNKLGKPAMTYLALLKNPSELD